MGLRLAAHALGGEVRGNRIHAPGPGHSKLDRSMWVTFDHQAPDGFIVGSFAGDDFRDCRDYVRAKLGMEGWKPNRSEEAQCLARRKELWAAREKSIGSNCADTPRTSVRGRKGEGRPDGFASETAKITGESKATINRKIARAEKIEPEVLEQVKGTELDKGVVLDQLARRKRQAIEVWNSAKPLSGTAGEVYLVNRVGGDMAWPADLRFHPRCARRIQNQIEYRPAVIALLRDIDTDEPKAVQRIFLRPDGSDRLRDAMGKATLGLATACVCKLSPDADVTLGLGISEGVEKGLTLMRHGWRPIWVTCGTSGMSSFPVLAGVELTIFADNDSAGREAAAKCSKRWADAELPVRVLTPKTPGADWNDELGCAA